MKQSEIYKDLLCHIIDRLKAEHNFDDSTANDMKDEIDFTSDISNRSWLNHIVDLDIYQHFVNELQNVDATFDDPEITPALFFYREQFSQDYECEAKPFFVFDISSNFGMITSLQLQKFKLNGGTEILPIIAKLWLTIKDNEQLVNCFWDDCIPHNPTVYYVLSETQINQDKLWDAYGYAYLYYINNHRFEIPSQLQYSASTKLTTTLNFDANNSYRQYFDVFHVLIESKHCHDILKRFLHIYQVLEDLCYRLLMVDIAKVNLHRSSFVRKSIHVFHDRNNEKDTISRGFQKLFTDSNTILTDADVLPHSLFLENHYSIDRARQHCGKKIFDIIYNLRNSIVHNKHTEFHFSYGNISEYQDIIPLLTKLTQNLENEIMQILNNSTKTILDYQTQHIQIF